MDPHYYGNASKHANNEELEFCSDCLKVFFTASLSAIDSPEVVAAIDVDDDVHDRQCHAGSLALASLLALWLFAGIYVVCDHYFIPSLEEFGDVQFVWGVRSSSPSVVFGRGCDFVCESVTSAICRVYATKMLQT